LIWRAFDEEKALLATPNLAGREQGTIDDGPRRPLIIGDLPFNGSDFGGLFLMRTLDCAKAIIAVLENTTDDFRAGHGTLPPDNDVLLPHCLWQFKESRGISTVYCDDRAGREFVRNVDGGTRGVTF
jgi:hypothetical protein